MDPTLLDAPLGSTTRGRLVFERGVARRVTIAGGAPRGKLYQAEFRGAAPEVGVDDGTVSLDYRPLRTWFSRHEPATVKLASGIPWVVDIEGGVANLEVDATALRLEHFEVRGGLADTTIRVGKLDAPLTVRILGGVAWLRVQRPAAIPASLRVTGGGANLSIDRQHLGAVGGETVLESPQYEHDKPRVDVEVRGGAANVEVTAT